jgi:Family of unknown function (DUF5758)/MORN repeat variant
MAVNEDNNAHIGYKKCQDGRIVQLEILGDHNEDRENVVDKRFAKMRCSKAKVIRIYDMHDPSIEYDEAFGIHNKSFRYAIGEIVEPIDEFNGNPNKVCASGIHYFLREEPAYHWGCKAENGMYERWYESGQIKVRCTIKDGKPEGLYEAWYENGQMWERCTYKDGNKMVCTCPGTKTVRCCGDTGTRTISSMICSNHGTITVNCGCDALIRTESVMVCLYEVWHKNGSVDEKETRVYE